MKATPMPTTNAMYDNTGWRPAQRLPVARALGETSLMFLVHPTLTGVEIERTTSAIREVLTAALLPE